MITVKEAATKAANYLKDLMPGATSFQIEEVEPSESNKVWSITLSYVDPEIMFGGKSYKVIKVRKSDGEVLSMKIRNVQ
jgi:hypothetical protein